MNNKGINTLAVHGGEIPDPETGASSPNIVMSSTYVVDQPTSFSVTNMDDDTPYVYTRWANPTIRQLEKKLCLLENAESCLACASGMSASSGVLFGLLNSGDHLIISESNYPGTAEISRQLLPKNNIKVTPVDTSNPENIKNAICENTRMIWVETPSNPLVKLTDIQSVSRIAKDTNALLVVDSTFASPIATRPLELGADIVVHSLTKYIGGHGDAIGGAVLSSRQITSEIIAGGMLHYGGTISPFNAWLIMRGAATLPLRMTAHQKNAMQVATFLEAHPNVDLVRYPGLSSHPQHDLANSQMNNYSGMIAFRTPSPQSVAKRMMDSLKIVHYAVSLGHHRSLIFLLESDDLINSSYKLDGKLEREYREIAGQGVFRLSVGIEDAEDIIRDLELVLG
ncbi:MAG: PLP-dependent aspartate aminotransferase family protein [Gammaproteobacteria bacterium]|nr:PLP-dependent aspartate aminotransferase family protein [Gammaproteobacteria bacterium]MCY4218241.1 PLP-dependent aspartate aminotransferase family protein [Gammaproteobacteria bacterium]